MGYEVLKGKKRIILPAFGQAYLQQIISTSNTEKGFVSNMF